MELGLTDSALSFLEDIYGYARDACRSSHVNGRATITDADVSFEAIRSNTRVMLEQATELQADTYKERYKDCYKAIIIMFDRPYWTRCWILQELAVSKDVVVRYGSDSISLSTIKLFCNIFDLTMVSTRRTILKGHATAHIELMSEICRSMEHFESINKLLDDFSKSSTMRLRTVLSTSRIKASTDHKDRVYALLGLINSIYDINLVYSSDWTVTDIFATTTRAIIEHEGSLDVLSDGQEVRKDITLGLHSWVPDFSVDQGYTAMIDAWVSEKFLKIQRVFEASLFSRRKEFQRHTNITLPNFLSDISGRPNRVLRCSMLDLGHIALQHTFSSPIGPVSKSNLASGAVLFIHHVSQNCKEILAAAGLDGTYPKAITQAMPYTNHYP